MDIEVVAVTLITALSTLIVGFLAGQWSALRARIEATPTKIDDTILAIVDRVLKAKAEDPGTPLGTPPASGS